MYKLTEKIVGINTLFKKQPARFEIKGGPVNNLFACTVVSAQSVKKKVLRELKKPQRSVLELNTQEYFAHFGTVGRLRQSY